MAHRFPNILIHLVFSTKQRKNLIPDKLLTILYRYLMGIGTNTHVPVLAAGGTANHLHLLIALPPDTPVAKAVQMFKANSSRWIREHAIDFQWQEGYGAFSVSASNAESVKHYIEHQSEHHARRPYEDEFVTFLRKSGIRYEAETVFD